MLPLLTYDRLRSQKKQDDFIYVNHLSQYQAEQAVLKWFRKTIKISAKDGKTMEVEIVVGRGEKLSKSIPALFKEFGISAEYSEFAAKVRATFEQSEFARLVKYFDLEDSLEVIRTDPETNKEVPRLINGHGHMFSMWTTEDVLEKTILKQVVDLMSARVFQTLSKPTVDSAAAIYDTIQELLNMKPKNLSEVLAAMPTQKKFVIYTFSPASINIGLEEGSFLDIGAWEEVSLVREILNKEEDSAQQYVILRADKSKETKKIDLPPFGERLRRTVDELDEIQTTKTIILIIYLSSKSKKASSFIRYKAGWNQYMIDELY